jgi:hypothetical protein
VFGLVLLFGYWAQFLVFSIDNRTVTTALPDTGEILWGGTLWVMLMAIGAIATAAVFVVIYNKPNPLRRKLKQ